VQAIDQIESWTRQFGIECDFRRVSAVAYTERADRADRIHAEYEAAHRLGLDVVVKSDAGLPFATAAALEIRDQARFHVLKYLRGLAQAVQGGTISIYESTRAEPPDDGDPCTVRANGHQLVATDVIVATHSSYLGISQFDMRQAAYQSYVLAVRVDDDVPDALYWDDEQPYHYIRLASSDDRRLLIIGGADHKTGEGNEVEHVRQLRDYVSRRFAVVGIEQQWSAEFFEPSDGLPMIGRVPFTDHLYIATGFSGTGLTYGTAAGKILADLILSRASQYAPVFSPTRFKPLTAAKDFISENLNAAMHFATDRFSAEHLKSLDMVKTGEGRIVQLNGAKYAVYRDEQNQLHQMSPVCTHAGCYVQWNDLEKTWDCPCHGGRYSPTGERLYGPPPADLERNVSVAVD
jgi:glycine/D-amino acid oxidase-like deaminating enzyme/nitrite reductase/ring-hydroxylating ferredoxin subunit